MADTSLPCSDAHNAYLHKRFPGLDSVPHDKKIAHMCQLLMSEDDDATTDAGGQNVVSAMSLSEIHDKARVNRTETKAELTRARAEQSRLESENTRLTNDVRTMSRTIVKPPDEHSQKTLLQGLKILRGQCVAKGALDTATADVLFELMVQNAQGKINAMSLSPSSNANGSADECLATSIFTLMANNKPKIKIGEDTASQTTHVMSRADDSEEEKKETKAPHEKFNDFLHGSPATTVM